MFKQLDISFAHRGMIQIAVSALFTVLMGIFVKLLHNSVPSSNLLVYRALIQGIFCVIVGRYNSVQLMGPKEHSKLLNLRGFLGGIQIFLYFSTMQYLPIAMATALFMTTPIYSLFLGAIFLHEAITKRKSAAVIISVLGIVLVSHPATWSSNPHDFYGSLCAIGEAVSTAFIVIIIKKMGGNIHYTVLVLYLSMYMLGLGLVLSIKSGFVSLDFGQFFLVFMCGSCAFISQSLLCAGVQKVSAVTSMTVRSLDVVFAFLLGITLLGDEITLAGIAGSTIILFGSYLIVSANLQPNGSLPSTKEVYYEVKDDIMINPIVKSTDPTPQEDNNTSPIVINENPERQDAFLINK